MNRILTNALTILAGLAWSIGRDCLLGATLIFAGYLAAKLLGLM